MRRHDKRNAPRTAHARHILVADKPTAKIILEQLSEAKNPLKAFKKLARKYSICQSGSKKGDLGEFIEGQMVRKFEDAVWLTEIETVPTKFVKTQFGYHIIWVHSKGETK